MVPRLLLACFIFSACGSLRMVETSLYFGQSKAGGGQVSAQDWQAFSEKYLSKVFKEGSTQVSVKGYWFDEVKQKLVTEPTFIVISFHKNSAQYSRQIDSLRYWYKKLYDQQSVLRVDKKIKASF